MSKSFALALAALAFSAASALASPAGPPIGGSVGGSVPQQNSLRTAQALPVAPAQFGRESQGFSGYSGNAFVPPSVSIPAAPAPVRDSTLGLVNETGGGD